MNLKDLSDDVLLQRIEKLCSEERELLVSILHHLREIEKRKLYANLKLPSLFEYTVKKLGYSEDQAYRRIAAMKILKELPELEEKINSGDLQLSHLGMANSFFNREKQLSQKDFSKEEKLEILSKIENKSAREAEKIVLSMASSPILHRPERERIIAEEMVEINFVARGDLKEKIQKLKGLLAHKSPHMSTAELIERLCDLGLEKWGKGINFFKNISEEKQGHNLSKTLIAIAAPEKEKAGASEITEQWQHQEDQQSWEKIKKFVWRRDKGQCQNCGSSYALEVDHILPKAKGGEDSINNLRLLCRSCNQRAAIQHFGLNKMQRHLN